MLLSLPVVTPLCHNQCYMAHMTHHALDDHHLIFYDRQQIAVLWAPSLNIPASFNKLLIYYYIKSLWQHFHPIFSTYLFFLISVLFLYQFLTFSVTDKITTNLKCYQNLNIRSMAHTQFRRPNTHISCIIYDNIRLHDIYYVWVKWRVLDDVLCKYIHGKKLEFFFLTYAYVFL